MHINVLVLRLRRWGLYSTSPRLKTLIHGEHYSRFGIPIRIVIWICWIFYFILKEYQIRDQVLQRILMGTDVVKNVNKNNASHAVLFEALSLVSS